MKCSIADMKWKIHALVRHEMQLGYSFGNLDDWRQLSQSALFGSPCKKIIFCGVKSKLMMIGNYLKLDCIFLIHSDFKSHITRKL